MIFYTLFKRLKMWYHCYRKVIDMNLNDLTKSNDKDLDNARKAFLISLKSFIPLKDEGILKHRRPISSLYLFEDYQDHKEVVEEFKKYLKYIDLSTISFDNVNVEDIDFSECNPLMLRPSTVYNKSIKGTIFTNSDDKDFPFKINTAFKGVNLYNTIINSNININIDGALTNENTKVNIDEKNKTL